MDCHNIISNLSKTISGEDFMNAFLIPENSGNLYFNLNDMYKLECPDDMLKNTCDNQCHGCWSKSLRKYGFKFSEDEITEIVNDLEVIDISIKLSVGEMLKELHEDNTKVFYSNKKLYFLKENVLKSADYESNESLSPKCDDVVIDYSIMNQSFNPTSRTINVVLSEINHSEVNDFLRNGNTLIYVIDERAWTISYDNHIISYSSADFDIEDPKYTSYLASDMINSHVVGAWFSVDQE